MNNVTLFAQYRTVPKLVLLGVMLAGAAAVAQPMEEITVVAPHQVHRKTVGRSSIGAPIEEISLSHEVEYGDLNLTKPEDVATLRDRIAAAAKEGCDELDELFPLDKDNDKNRQCVRDATREAQAQIMAAIESPKQR